MTEAESVDLVRHLASATGIMVAEDEVALVAAHVREYLGYIDTLNAVDVGPDDAIHFDLDIMGKGPTQGGPR